MKKLVLMLLTLTPFLAHAELTPPQGSYGIEHTANTKEAAFIIKGTTVEMVHEHHEVEAKILDDAGKTKLWERASLGDKGISESVCLKFEIDYICHIPADLRSAEGFTSLQTDFFFYSPMGDGIVSAFPL